MAQAATAPTTPAESRATPLLPAASSDYQVGPEDVLSITVYGEPQLSGKFRVDGDGSFPYQYLGRVKAEGLTTAAIGEALRKALGDGYLKNPQVSVEVDQVSKPERICHRRSAFAEQIPASRQLDLDGCADPGGIGDAQRRQLGGDPPFPQRRRSDGFQRSLRCRDSRAAHRHSDGKSTACSGARRRHGLCSQGGAYFCGGRGSHSRRFLLYDEGMTVFQAVSLAGGANEKGSNRYSIRRLIKGEMKEIDAKAEDLVLAGDQVNVKRRRL